jgi:hypothetical protein
MKKRLSAKTGEYTDKDNQQKGEYTQLGVILQSNDGGEYMLLDPSVSLAGVLAKQNVLAMNQGKPVRDSIMVGIYTDENQTQQQYSQQQAPQQNQAPQQQYQQQAPQQGYQQQPPQGYQQR